MKQKGTPSFNVSPMRGGLPSDGELLGGAYRCLLGIKRVDKGRGYSLRKETFTAREL